MNNQLIEELYKTIEAKDNIINNQALEIARLQQTKDKLQKDYQETRDRIDEFKLTITTQQQMIGELISKIDKAIEYIKELQNSCLVFSNIAYKELLEILGDKENE